MSMLLGLIGSGIDLSRTPVMQEREADEHGVRCIYQILNLDRLGGPDALPGLLDAAQRMGFAGLNITHPCKQAVIPLLDEVSPDAAALGAVNTVLFQNRRRRGENTDSWGFAEAFRRNMAGADVSRVVQLGSGGAGAAVAYALLTLGVQHLTLVDADPARAAALAGSLSAHFAGRVVAGDAADAVPATTGLVNCTPVGMAQHPGLPLPATLLHPALWVADIVYFPLETALLATARALGCRTLDGGKMAVFQAVQAFQLFTGLTPDPERMLRHFATMDE